MSQYEYWNTQPPKVKQEKAYRKDADSYMMQKLFESYGSDSMGNSVDAFADAFVKTQKAKERFGWGPHRFQVDLPYLLTGNMKGNVSLAFRVIPADNNGLVQDSDFVKVVGPLSKSSDVRSGPAVTKLLLTRNNNQKSSVVIDTDLKPIPGHAYFEIVASKEGKVITAVLGEYDVEIDRIDSETQVSKKDGSKVIILRLAIRGIGEESEDVTNHLPKCDLVMHIKVTNGKYLLKKAVLECNYHPAAEIRGNPSSDSLVDIFTAARPTIPALRPMEPASDYTSMQTQIERLIMENLTPEEIKTLDLMISKSDNGSLSPLFRMKAAKPSSMINSSIDGGNEKKVYFNAGKVTRILAALTLLRLLQNAGYDWMKHAYDSSWVTNACLKDTLIGKALSALYARSCDCAGPSLHQLLTNTAGLPQHIQLAPEAFYDKLLEVLDDAEQRELTENDEADEIELANQLKNVNLIDLPGVRVFDSDLGWAIIGIIIRKLSGYQNQRKAMLETARMLGMNSSYFIPNSMAKLSSEKYCNILKHRGHCHRVFAANAGLVCTATDLDNLIQRFHSKIEPISGMNNLMQPQFNLLNPTLATCISWLMEKVYLDHQNLDSCYSNIFSTGYSPNGDVVHLSVIPEHNLCVRWAMKKSNCLTVENIVRGVCSLILRRQCLPCESTTICESIGCHIAPYPPYHTCSPFTVEKMVLGALRNTLRCAPQSCPTKVVSPCRCCNVSWKHRGISNPADCFPASTSCLDRLSSHKVILVPLIAHLNLANVIVVHKESDGSYKLKTSSAPPEEETENGIDLQNGEILVVPDQNTKTYRIKGTDGQLGDYIQTFETKTEKGNPVFGLSIDGTLYFNLPYVWSAHNLLKQHRENIGCKLNPDLYQSSSSGYSESSKIGSALPWIVGGMAGAGLVYAATRPRVYPYPSLVYNPYLSDYTYLGPPTRPVYMLGRYPNAYSMGHGSHYYNRRGHGGHSGHGGPNGHIHSEIKTVNSLIGTHYGITHKDLTIKKKQHKLERIKQEDERAVQKLKKHLSETHHGIEPLGIYLPADDVPEHKGATAIGIKKVKGKKKPALMID